MLISPSIPSIYQINFQLWSEVLEIVKSKGHLTYEGLEQIIAIKSHFPNGLSPLYESFSEIASLFRSPEFSTSTNNSVV